MSILSNLSGGPTWASTTQTRQNRNACTANNKIVVIVGPTGSGKSRLSIDLATRFFPSEIINSDKIQVYRGLDVTTNKIPTRERLGVPHHFLGEFDSDTELTQCEFRSLAASTISEIISRGKLPLIVGGSNSFVYSLVADRFNPESDVFNESQPDSVSTKLRYKCCFLWVDVSLPVLNQYLSKRVDEMLDSGMFDELREYFNSEEYTESDSVTQTGLRKAIGIPEFRNYFKTFGTVESRPIDTNPEKDAVMMYDEAVRAIKNNTCQLAKRQLGKIKRLREAGWDLRRLDATAAVRATMEVASSDYGGWSDVWERELVEPSVGIVKRFLEE